MKKLLFISNITKRITNFTLPSIEVCKEMGYEFHLASNLSEFNDDLQKYNIKLHHIDITRNPLSFKNIIAYKQMIELIRKEKYDAIHCNTPIGGLLGRICGSLLNVNKIIYTAHGFHFYKGAPIIHRTLFKGAEKFLARFTDAIITMNQEDYQAAKKFKIRNANNAYYIPGVGIDTKYYQDIIIDKINTRKSLNLDNNDIVLIAMGDLIDRKNYETSLKAVAKTNNSKVHFLICGNGPKMDSLKLLSETLGINNQVHFLGYRRDIHELLSISDIFLFPSYQEGLPRSMMEAMASGLPCIASKIRGNVDLIEDNVGGFLFNPTDVNGYANAINLLAQNDELRLKMSKNNLEKIKHFDVSNIIYQLKGIYTKVL